MQLGDKERFKHSDAHPHFTPAPRNWDLRGRSRPWGERSSFTTIIIRGWGTLKILSSLLREACKEDIDKQGL